MAEKIAFIGLGAMGSAMAGHLVSKGYDVHGYDIRPEAGQALARAGGRHAASVAEAAADADILLLMVVNAAQAEDVLFGAGALAALPKGALCLLMATCAPADVERIAARVSEAGCRFVDAPVSGGVAGARAAALTIMAAAPADILAAARPVLDALGDKVFHVGERPGQGAAVKTINQLLCGVHIVAAAEAMTLGARAGLDLGVLLEILSGSAASSWMLKDRGPRMLSETPPVTSAVDIFVKDMDIVLAAGRSSKTPLPLAALAHQMYLAVSGMGGGTLDDSQVLRAYQRLTAGMN